MKRRVVYKDIPVERGTFVVDELSGLELAQPKNIRQILGLITTSYTAQYAPTGVMTKEDIHARYNPEDWSNVWRYGKATMKHFIGSGSQFFVGRSDAQPDDFLSFVKISNGPKSDQTAPEGSIYLNDVIARPPWRNGHGGATAHAAFRFGGHQDAPLLLEGFEGSSVNEWYTNRWGLEPGALSQQFGVGGAQERYFRSPEGHVIGNIALRLEQNDPALLSAREV